MNEEKLKKLYAEAALSSKTRLQREKQEEARRRSVAAAEVYCQRREKELLEKRQKRLQLKKELESLIDEAQWYQERLAILRKWLQDLNKRYERVRLRPWQQYLNRMMAKALERDIPPLQEEYERLADLIAEKRRQR